MAFVQTLIIGAGASGLSCARHLEIAQHDWMLFESADEPGGRLRTHVTDGFQLDRGFQVFLTAYPEAAFLREDSNLRLASFAPGARIWLGDRWTRVGDPLRRPGDFLPTLFSAVGGLADKLRVLAWGRRVRRASIRALMEETETTAREALEAMGFSERMIERFWRPFFSGIFLEADLATSSRMLHFVFKMFGEGTAALPAGGMGALAAAMARPLPTNRLRFGHVIDSLAGNRARLASGGSIEAENIVVATDGASAARLLPDLPPCAFHRVTCDHFEIPEPPPLADRIHLNGSGHGPVNTIAFPAAVQPAYAPRGRHLATVSCLRSADLETVLADLTRFFGDGVRDWTHLQRDEIDHALPARPMLDPPEIPVRLGPGRFLIGDHRGLPSLNSALASGRRAAEAIIARLPA